MNRKRTLSDCFFGDFARLAHAKAKPLIARKRLIYPIVNHWDWSLSM